MRVRRREEKKKGKQNKKKKGKRNKRNIETEWEEKEKNVLFYYEGKKKFYSPCSRLLIFIFWGRVWKIGPEFYLELLASWSWFGWIMVVKSVHHILCMF